MGPETLSASAGTTRISAFTVEEILSQWDASADLPEILRLEEWHQPDFSCDDNPPSNAEVYQQLAEVLVSGDLTRYAPTKSPNTHWSHWPESGEL